MKKKPRNPDRPGQRHNKWGNAEHSPKQPINEANYSACQQSSQYSHPGRGTRPLRKYRHDHGTKNRYGSYRKINLSEHQHHNHTESKYTDVGNLPRQVRDILWFQKYSTRDDLEVDHNHEQRQQYRKKAEFAAQQLSYRAARHIRRCFYWYICHILNPTFLLLCGVAYTPVLLRRQPPLFSRQTQPPWKPP